jgi:hypothetical protein
MSYNEWDARNDVSFFLELVKSSGEGLTGSLALIAIKRVRQVSGSFLDGKFWDGSSSFTSTPTFLTMSQVDQVNMPGEYSYCFSQSLVGDQNTYCVYFRHDTEPVGFSSEIHSFTSPSQNIYVNLPDSGSIHVYESEEELH